MGKGNWRLACAQFTHACICTHNRTHETAGTLQPQPQPQLNLQSLHFNVRVEALNCLSRDYSFRLPHVLLLEEELSVQVGNINRVKINLRSDGCRGTRWGGGEVGRRGAGGRVKGSETVRQQHVSEETRESSEMVGKQRNGKDSPQIRRWMARR